MIVTITECINLGQDDGNVDIPVIKPAKSNARTTNGAFPALDQSTNYIRVASDTNITLTDEQGNVYYIPANFPDQFGVRGAEVFTVATVA